MNDPTLKLRDAFGDTISSAMTTAGYTAAVFANPDPGQSLPYVLIGGATSTPRHNKTHDGTFSTQLFIAWAATEDAAQTLAGVVLAAVTNRSAPPSVHSSVKLITHDLDQIGPVLVEETPDGRRFGVPVRLRHRTHE
jgi:hypothetical protein